jgi:eukaryotic-like serine/threonine-protein kinase
VKPEAMIAPGGGPVAGSGGAPSAGGAAKRDSREKASWGFEEGAAIAPGRTVLRSLGGGSRYEVHLVWDEKLFSLAVAKLLRPDQAENERALRDLRKEAEALERLNHPVLLRGFDAVLEGPHPHVLVEHLEGPTLRRLIKKGGPLPPQQLLPLILHVAAAIHYMATEEMVHLDVKPDNIVMGIPPRLIDLSIARSFERVARLSGPVGTDGYMAPEQCDPEANPGLVGPPADVFGLGATAYHALAGHVPFPRPRGARESEDPLVRFPQLREAPRPLPAGVPEPLAELVTATLAHDPAERPTAAELGAGLEPLVAALPSKLVLGKRGASFR